MARTPDRPWVVLKFGGTSVATAGGWDTIAAQASARVRSGHRVLIVVSALRGVTDRLEQVCADAGARGATMAEIETLHSRLFTELGLEPGPAFVAEWARLSEAVVRLGDAPVAARRAGVVAAGERLCTALGAQALAARGVEVRPQEACDLLAVDADTSTPLAAHCIAERDAALAARLADDGAVHLTQGFQAAGPCGEPWLLGRGGSDTSAACLAARLGAKRVEIWTDVPGMFSADPRIVADARLLTRLSYSEAQELASMGARVLHPPSVRIAQDAGVLIEIRDTGRPDAPGTRIGPRSAETEAQVKGIVSRGGVTLVTMESADMWRRVGFLADAFAVFKRHGLSVDLVSTSEASVTVSLDPSHSAAAAEGAVDALVQDLSRLCRVQLRPDRASISLVGNAIRTILGRLSEALEVFQDRKVYLVTQSANDLNLTLVVDAEHAEQLVQKLHALLIAPHAELRPEFGPSWAELRRDETPSRPPATWWREARQALLDGMPARGARYVYDLSAVRAAARSLRGMGQVGRVLYAVKANAHPEILRTLHAEGLGFDCVSIDEVRHLLRAVPGLGAERILFTPNFADREEYAEALGTGVTVTIDNPYPAHAWPELFAGRDVFLRVDLDAGYGHHRKVITSGARSKFGIARDQLDALAGQLAAHGARVTGLHAHTGSGVTTPGVWAEQLEKMLEVLPAFPEVRVVDLGGGLGVPDHARQAPLDLAAVDGALARVARPEGVELWIEPGRFLVAAAGVLLARVTQLKRKGGHRYVGVATGMNSLIRPALYGAWHEIVNLTRLGEEATHRYTVVGPICESGDVLGEGRYLPETREGDVLLVANAGAYGRTMASHYNLRAPAEEWIVDSGG